MMDHLLGENPDLRGVVLDGPTIPMKNKIIALMIKRFSRMLKKGQVFHRMNSQKITENPIDQACHKCGSSDHFVKFCPLNALEKKRNSS